MIYKINVEDVPEEIEAKRLEEAERIVMQHIDILEDEDNEEVKVLKDIEKKIKQKKPLTNVEQEIYSSPDFR